MIKSSGGCERSDQKILEDCQSLISGLELDRSEVILA